MKGGAVVMVVIIVAGAAGAGGYFAGRSSQDENASKLARLQLEELHKKRYESHPPAPECDFSAECEMKEARFLVVLFASDQKSFKGRGAGTIVDRLNDLIDEAESKRNASVVDFIHKELEPFRSGPARGLH